MKNPHSQFRPEADLEIFEEVLPQLIHRMRFRNEQGHKARRQGLCGDQFSDEMPKPIPHTEEDKGDRVHIDGGLCEGLRGWMHDNANAFEDKAWIVVEQGTSNKGKVNEVETARLLSAHNFTLVNENLDFDKPETHEEALLSEHKDIARDMKDLAKKLAQFDSFDPVDGAELLTVFWHAWMNEKSKRNRLARTQGTRFVRSWVPHEAVAQGDSASCSPPERSAFPMDANFDDISSVGEGFGTPTQGGEVTDDEDEASLRNRMKLKLASSVSRNKGPNVVF